MSVSNDPLRIGGEPLNDADRRSAFSSGPPKMSRRVIVMMIAAILVLGLGGIVADHFFPGTGSPATVTTTTALPASLGDSASTAHTTTTPGANNNGQAITAPGRQLSASLDALMSLVQLSARTAPSLSLDSEEGKLVSLVSLRGKVVVLSFFDASCNDICPVLASEIRRADGLLGQNAQKVEFLTVNSDPTHTSAEPAPAGLLRSDLTSISNWTFLSGSLQRLNPIWTAYGVTISVVTATNTVSHNDVLDFIDADGRLRFKATPYANESRGGVYSLGATMIDEWSNGIVDVIDKLLMAEK